MPTNNSTINPTGVDWGYVPSTTTGTNSGITSDGINIYDPYNGGPSDNFNIVYSNLNLRRPNQQLAKENFDLIVDYKDVNKEGIFKIGYLYKFNKNAFTLSNTYVKDSILSIPYFILLQREFSAKKPMYNDELLLSCCDDGDNSEVFLCLDSTLEERDDLLSVSKNGKIKTINKSWITRFLVDEKIYQFKWIENPLYTVSGYEGYNLNYNINGGSYCVVENPCHNFFIEI